MYILIPNKRNLNSMLIHITNLFFRQSLYISLIITLRKQMLRPNMIQQSPLSLQIPNKVIILLEQQHSLLRSLHILRQLNLYSHQILIIPSQKSQQLKQLISSIFTYIFRERLNILSQNVPIKPLFDKFFTRIKLVFRNGCVPKPSSL